MLERPFIKQYNHIVNEFLFIFLIQNSNYFWTMKGSMKGFRFFNLFHGKLKL